MTDTSRTRSESSSAAYASDRPEVTGWAGWVAFAGVMMIMLGIFQAIEGLVGIFDDGYYVVRPSGLHPERAVHRRLPRLVDDRHRRRHHRDLRDRGARPRAQGLTAEIRRSTPGRPQPTRFEASPAGCGDHAHPWLPVSPGAGPAR
jgi:hypothetical protein